MKLLRNRFHYTNSRATFHQHLIPIAALAAVMTLGGMGLMYNDWIQTGVFWGWWILAFMTAVLGGCAYLWKWKRWVLIDRDAGTVEVNHWGWFEESRSHRESLKEFAAVGIGEREFSSSGSHRTGTMYIIQLRRRDDTVLEIMESVHQNQAFEEAAKVAVFLKLESPTSSRDEGRI